MMRAKGWGLSLVAGAVALLGGCGSEPTVPAFAPKDQASCNIAKNRAHPLIVEWPAADRASLEAKARRGIVAVRYDGCAMEVLSHCSVSGGYGYVGLTRKHDRIAISNFDELYANIPTHAVDFEGKLKASGRLDVTLTIVGQYEANKNQVKFEELQGSCDGATHVVSAFTAGAFQFSAGAERDANAGATLPVGGAHGASSSKRELLNQDGDESACQRATRSDHEPPEGCGALLRVEVMPVLGLPERERSPVMAAHGPIATGPHAPFGGGTSPAPARTTRATTLAAPESCPAGMNPVKGGRMLLVTPREAPVGLVLDGAPGASRWVEVGGLCVDQALVTARDYAQCVREGACSAEQVRCGPGDSYSRQEGPINCVAWADADSYCKKQKARLPTEEEWEWIARAGALAWPEPWGERPFQKRPTVEAVLHDSDHTPEGIRQLIGGLWQWTASPASSGAHALRGGAFGESAPEAFVVHSSRTSRPDATRQTSNGFRCVK